MPGHRFDTVGVAPLIKGVEFGALLADKAFDSNEIIAEESGQAEALPCAVMAAGDDAAALEASLIENVARLNPD